MRNQGTDPARHSRRFVAFSLFLLLGVLFTCPGMAAKGELPLTRAVLFKNGMGFFEHEGVVKDQETVRISITSSQLDDVLKSLTVLDQNGGHIGAISYGSSEPLDRQLRELQTGDLRGKDLAAILKELTGVTVEADAPEGRFSGRLLNADVRRVDSGGGGVSEIIELALYTDDGELHTLSLRSLKSLKITSDPTRRDLSRYLDILTSARNDNQRILEIRTLGSGERAIKLSYTVEAPIWKASYRLILEGEKSAFLQGWAIVDNTTSSDWENIDLSLVSSSPVSFVQRLSEPVYADRIEVPVLADVAVRPEIHEGGMVDGSERVEYSGDAVNVYGQPPMLKTDTTDVAPPAPRAFASSTASRDRDISSAIRYSYRENAKGMQAGDQFEYHINEPVTLPRNQSALIPLLQVEIEADKVSVFTADRGERNPRNAVWLKNTTELTLDGGPFSIIDAGLFAGEGLFGTVYSGERRILSYALDRAVNIEQERESVSRSIREIIADRGVLEIRQKLVENFVYRVKNNTETVRQIVIEHPMRTGWDLVSPVSTEEESGNYYRFKLSQEAGKYSRFVVTEEKIQGQRISIGSVKEETLMDWMSDREMSDAARAQLTPLLELVREIAAMEEGIQHLEGARKAIFESQGRLRQNLSSLGATAAEAGLRQRYVSTLEEQEDQLADINRQKKEELDKMIALQESLAEKLAAIRF